MPALWLHDNWFVSIVISWVSYDEISCHIREANTARNRGLLQQQESWSAFHTVHSCCIPKQTREQSWRQVLPRGKPADSITVQIHTRIPRQNRGLCCSQILAPHPKLCERKCLLNQYIWGSYIMQQKIASAGLIMQERSFRKGRFKFWLQKSFPSEG